MYLQLSLAPKPEGLHVKLEAERLGGDTVTSDIVWPATQREKAITWCLIHTIARKADRYMATADGIMASDRHEHHNATNLDAAAHKVLVLDQVVGSISDQESLHAIETLVPMLYWFVGQQRSISYQARHREWKQLETLAKLLKRRLEFPGADSCTTCLTPLEAGDCITCAHREAKQQKRA